VLVSEEPVIRTKRVGFAAPLGALNARSASRAEGGRHTSSAKMLPYNLVTRPSTAPSSPLAPLNNVVRTLNGRVHGANRYSSEYARLPDTFNDSSYQLQPKHVPTPLLMFAKNPSSSSGVTVVWVT